MKCVVNAIMLHKHNVQGIPTMQILEECGIPHTKDEGRKGDIRGALA